MRKSWSSALCTGLVSVMGLNKSAPGKAEGGPLTREKEKSPELHILFLRMENLHVTLEDNF